MLKFLFSTLFLTMTLSVAVMAQSSPVGLWKTIDDNTGDAKSYVEIYEKNGKFYGKIDRLLIKPNDSVCESCSGAKKDKPLVGMEILWDIKPYKDYWSYGTIMDPENGKEYKLNVWFEDGETDKLQLRGYIGMPALGRTQTWHRVK